MIFAQFVLMLWLVMNVLSSDHEVKVSEVQLCVECKRTLLDPAVQPSDKQLVIRGEAF